MFAAGLNYPKFSEVRDGPKLLSIGVGREGEESEESSTSTSCFALTESLPIIHAITRFHDKIQILWIS